MKKVSSIVLVLIIIILSSFIANGCYTESCEECTASCYSVYETCKASSPEDSANISRCTSEYWSCLEDCGCESNDNYSGVRPQPTP